MNKIFWTYEHFIGKEYEGHPHEGRHCVIALSPSINDYCYCFTLGEDSFIHRNFHSKEEAFLHIEQCCKPDYAAVFNTNYELVYLDSKSDDWYDVYEKFDNFLGKIIELMEYNSLPAWKKWWMKLLKFFKKN